MKINFIFLLLITTSVFGQSNNQDTLAVNCNDWIIEKTDPITGGGYLALKEALIVQTKQEKKSVTIDLVKMKDRTLILEIKGNKYNACIDRGAKVSIQFDDGTTLQMVTEAPFNCTGRSTLYFGGIIGHKKELEELRTKKVASIIQFTSIGNIDSVLSDEQGNKLNQAFKCMTN